MEQLGGCACQHACSGEAVGLALIGGNDGQWFSFSEKMKDVGRNGVVSVITCEGLKPPGITWDHGITEKVGDDPDDLMGSPRHPVNLLR